MAIYRSPGAAGHGIAAASFPQIAETTRYRRPRAHATLGALVALCAIGAATGARADNGVGAWISPVDNNWPLIPVHAALTPDGRVLTYGTKSDGTQTGYFIYDVWDPTAGLGGGHFTLNNMTLTDIFCSSQVILPSNGNIFIAGGDNWTGTATTNTGNNNTNVFSYSGNTLTRGNNMNRARWYSSSTALVNGEIYVQGGNGGGDYPEVRDGNGNFRLLTGASTSAYAATYPRNFLAPDGRVFGYDTNGNMYFVNTAGTGSLSTAGTFNSANAGWTSSAAMFRPGKILQMGGNSAGAVVIDINGPTPVVTTQPTMSSQRQWVSATVMADGRVLATGGTAVDNQLTGINNSAEVWNPATGQWTVGPSGSRARMYHSGALLLPDATVMVHGGGAPGPLNNLHAEIYQPSYLFTPAGALAQRPTIVSAPDNIDNGQHFSVNVGTASISRVTLVRSGSVTHSVNMDQRFIELPFTSSGGLLDVESPPRASDAPGGYYMLFVIDNQGVPSKAKIVRMSIAANPNIAVDYTPTIGGNGGSAFALSCASDQIAVGVAGRASTTDYIYQLALQCARVDQFGHWVGDPVAGAGSTGGTGGTPFTKTCPRDTAISGFSGRSATYVNQLNFECKALTGFGRVTGAAQALGAVGSTQGNAQASMSCGTSNPVYALYGRSGSWIDNFGMQCRQATITPISVNSPPVITNPGNQTATVSIPVTLNITVTDPDGNPLTFSATGLPPGLSIGTNISSVTGTPTAAGTYNVAVSAFDGQATSTANFVWTVVDLAPLVLNAMPSQSPRLVNTSASYTASVQNALNPRFKWFFDDGTPETAYSGSPGITHTFANPGVYYVSVTATDDRGISQVQTFAQTVYLPPTPNKPAISGNIAYETRSGSNSRVWVVNQDNDSVTAFDAVTNAKLAEIGVGTAPRALAVSPTGEIWVTNKLSASITVINAGTLAVSRTIALPFASQPFGIAFAPTGGYAFVVLEGTGSLLKLDAITGGEVASLPVGANPRHLSVSGDGGTVYVSRFITPRLVGEETLAVQANAGGEIIVINAGAMSVLNTITLAASTKPDFDNQGSGFANYLGAAAISPDGTAAWVPSKQDNVARGMQRNGLPLNFQNTVRAISSRIALATGAEDAAARIDHDNASVASAAAFDRYGVYLFVALETSREVAVVDAHGKYEIFRLDVGRAPQGLVISPDGSKLYVNNFMDRSISVFDLTNLVNNGQWNAQSLGTLNAVATEKLSAQVLKGKQLFYDARDTRLGRDRYLSCATCHNDGGHDGRVWDLGGFGEGLRNTISLRGRGGMGQGFLHWSANFDEVQDFEGQIRALAGGTGLMADADFTAGTRSQPLGDPKTGLSADLDALAAYLGSLTSFASSPNRNPDGTLTSAALAGKSIFQSQNCSQCHTGPAFTDSGAAILHNIGTIKPSSGQRLGGPLTGIDTPTLRDVWATAPYLHDGSAATLGDAIRAHGGIALSDPDLAKLAAYVSQIGGQEATAPIPNVAPTISNPGAQSGTTGSVVNLTITAGDINGDSLTFSASGLPAGLGISASTGVITGTLTTAAVSDVTVTVSDGALNASASFTWTVTVPADTTAPTAPGSATATAVSGSQINVSWGAATDNVGVTGYEVERCQGAGCSSFALVATVSGTSYGDAGLTPATSYSYRVRAFDAANNKSSYSATGSTMTPDTVAPTAPGGLTASAISSSQINLSWSAATDNVGVTNYLIERCQGAGCSSFAQIATSTTTSYSNTGLTAATSYSYRVRATDAAGNLGGYSNSTSATTAAMGSQVTPAFKQVNYTAPTSSQTTVNVTFTAAQSAGDLNVVAIAWYDTTSQILSVTDNRGNNYVRAAGPTSLAQTGTQAIYYASNIVASAAGGTTVTVTFNAAVPYPDIRIAEYSGIDPLNPLDVSAAATGSSATSNSGSATTTSPIALLVGANYVQHYTNAAGSGYTSRAISSLNGSILEDRVVSAVGSYNATAAINSGTWIMQMVAFRAAAQ
jgi:YVTN family beta-propeller protein